VIEALTKGEALKKHPEFHRVSLLKRWKKAIDSDPVLVCTHDKTRDWNCGCTFGCDVCGYSAECLECKNILQSKTRSGKYTPSIWLA